MEQWGTVIDDMRQGFPVFFANPTDVNAFTGWLVALQLLEGFQTGRMNELPIGEAQNSRWCDGSGLMICQLRSKGKYTSAAYDHGD